MVSWNTWSAEPLVLASATVSLSFFVFAFARLRSRRRREHAGVGRAVVFVAAVALGTFALVSPLDSSADLLLSAHMVQHVMIGDAVPALLLVSLRGPLLLFLLPKDVLLAVMRRGAVRRSASFLLQPRVSMAVWAAAITAWHVPFAYDYALNHPVAHELEHLSFLTGGLLAWSQIIDPAHRNMLSVRQRIGCATGMLLVTGGLSLLLLLAPPLYPFYFAQPTRLLGLSPHIDQGLAGVVMLGEQLLVFVISVVLLVRLERAHATATHRGASRTSSDRRRARLPHRASERGRVYFLPASNSSRSAATDRQIVT